MRTKGSGREAEKTGKEGDARNRKRRGREEPEKKGTRGTGKEGKHLRNGCGSEAGKSERKRTVSLSTGTGKERTGNQAGENGGSRRSESEDGALRKPLRGGIRKKGKGSAEAE